MERKYPHLCQPITLGNVTFRNRMFASPIGATDIDKDCVPGERTRAFYELRAKGGAAAVTMSELVVHPETDGSHMLHLDLATVGSPGCFHLHSRCNQETRCSAKRGIFPFRPVCRYLHGR